jgi:ankyrin repeat protein
VEKLLKSSEVDAGFRDSRGRTVISYTASTGKLEVMELLLKDNEVDADTADHQGRTPLSWAAPIVA